MVTCRICKYAYVPHGLPICYPCKERGNMGHLDWIGKRRYRNLFIDLRNSNYEDIDPNGYRFVREVLIKNGVSIPGSDDHTLRNLIAIASIILTAITIILRIMGYF